MCLLLSATPACSLVDGEPKVIAGDHPTLLAGVDSGEVMDAQLTGYLTDSSGCFGVALGSRDLVVVVWPEGTDVRGSGDDVVVVSPDGRKIHLNEEFSLGGGVVPATSESVPSNRCEESAEYFLANSPQR